MSVWKILAELDFMPGVSMVTPDANYTLGQKNFQSQEEPDEWPYEDDANGGGPVNATGDTGQAGVGRGGVGWGGRKDVSGGIREPSGVYQKTWQIDEAYEDNGGDRHGNPRNVWRDTPDGENWTELNNEAMGTPMNFTMSNKSGNMSGHTVPGLSRNEPAARKNFIPEDEEMNLKEFFDADPIPVEGVENDNPAHPKDQTDDDLENKIDRNYGLESNDDFGEPPESPLDIGGDDDVGGMISIAGPMDTPGPQQMMSKLASPGPSGLLPPGMGGGEVVQKSSAWDVLQKVVDALGQNLNDGC